MYANGATTDKESSVQRLDRYIAEFRQKCEQAKRERWTGDLSLALNLNDGIPAAREISYREKSR